MMLILEYSTKSSVLQTIILIFVCTFLIWYVKYHWNRRKLYKMARQRKGPLALPFIGNGWCFINKNIIDVAMSLQDKYGPITPVWIGQELNFFLSDPEDLEVVMTSMNAVNKHLNYKYTYDTLGHGLITAPAEKWKRSRKALTPTFNQKILDGFVDIFVYQSQILVEKLKIKVGKAPFDVFDYVSRCSMDINFETEMGISINAQNSEPKLLKWVNKALEIALMRMFSIWYSSDFIFNLSSYSKIFRESNQNFQSFNDALIEKELAAYRSKVKNAEPEFVDGKPRLKTFLELIIELSETKSHFTLEELRHEVATFFVAGSETTASTVCYLLLCLALSPDAQKKVYDEIMEILGPDRNVNYKDLPKFTYLERAIKESLRIFSGGPLLGRTVTGDIKLKNGCIIPDGSFLTLVIHHIHRNPKIYPDPLKFDPDRFLPEEASKRHPYTWLPFSGGLRNCIGMKYAFMAVKTMVANIIRHYKVYTPYKSFSDIELVSQLVLKAPQGHLITLEERT